MPVDELRIIAANQSPVRKGGEYVLYWCIAARRTRYNFGLDRAVEWAAKLGKPLVFFEPLRVGYPWASDRLHRFVLEGMAENQRRLRSAPVLYYPYVEPAPGEGKGLLEELARRAAVVVTDHFPCFFLPQMVNAAAGRLDVKLEAIDSNGLLPLRAAETTFASAYAFRRFLQRELPPHLSRMPKADPFRASLPPRIEQLPGDVARRWPAADDAALAARTDFLASLPIDHDVGPAAFAGGSAAAEDALETFTRFKLDRYAENRNQPEADATSGLSPYLHFGHISTHEVLLKIAQREEWTPDRVSASASGKRAGWWNMSEPAEAFLDELVTWREIGYNFCHHRSDHDQFDALPDWAKKSLRKHSTDEREYVYSPQEFESARTHDPLWNAAQMQIVREGRMHNYLRMLWGKKILEWSASPEQSLEVMIELNNKYGVDGRDPNSYSGICWVLGRFDRPWGPERPIYGVIRCMSSDNTARKLRVKEYVEKYAP